MGELIENMNSWRKGSNIKILTIGGEHDHLFLHDSGYQITMVFRFHWVHLKELCNSFILKYQYLQYAGNYIISNYLHS